MWEEGRTGQTVRDRESRMAKNIYIQDIRNGKLFVDNTYVDVVD